jgi:large subunit ribosomal protein L29
MSLIAKKELKAMSIADLKLKLVELRKDLMKHNAQIAMGTVPKSPGLVKTTKKTIARILTIITEKEKVEKGGKN